MTGNAGERLFEAIGQIPDQMVLEAAQEKDSAPAAAGQPYGAAQSMQADQTKKAGLPEQARIRKPEKTRQSRLNSCFKYLPVAACLCLVLAGTGYVVNHFIYSGQHTGMQISGSLDDQNDGDGATEEGIITMDQGADTGDNADMKQGTTEGSTDMADLEYADGAEEHTSDADTAESAPKRTADMQKPMLPVRYDAYEGPVFPLTATGDTQKLKVSRRLKSSVVTQKKGDKIQPLLQVTDTYQIKNTSKQDKTLQLVYPFVTTLNRAFVMDGSILQVAAQEQAAVTYGIGESIRAYQNADPSEPTALEDYQQIFAEGTDYQEQALSKEADWERNVYVYTFSDIQVQEGADAANASGVIGVTVNGTQADVLTYGFDHSFTKEEGVRNYCFFIPQEEKKLLLLVTGEMEGEPELGYYANLDCEEKIAGISCQMEQQEMPFGDALRLCSKDAAKKLRDDYRQGLYDAELPEYMDEDAAFRVLTMISEEDDFYSVLMQRYENAELTEVFERMFGETRVVYAMATVTIPAKKAVRAVVQTQKRQNAGNFMLAPENDHSGNYRTENHESKTHAGVYDLGEPDGRDTYVYDFLSGTQSRFPIQKTDFRLALSLEWQLAEGNPGLKQIQDDVWKVKLPEENYQISITGVMDQTKADRQQ